jgi:hypothetical protein
MIFFFFFFFSRTTSRQVHRPFYSSFLQTSAEFSLLLCLQIGMFNLPFHEFKENW